MTSVEKAAESAYNNLSSMIRETATLPDGTPRNMDPTVLAGVLNAQGRLAIAGAILALAEATGRNRSE